MAASSSVGVAPVIWAAAVDPADVPMIRSAVGHIQPGIEQAGDDADQPGVACRSAATEDQGSLASASAVMRAGGIDGRRSRAREERVVFMGVAFRE